ncbi:MAG: ribbon-helix-helix protein, CopG family [Pasteurellaceae bacterium]|nr:ribbon-helix-helix protein, CopG family [Pasteurellaceae bacterium]
MAMTRQEINAKSDAKRGIKQKSLKLHIDTIALLERLSEEMGIGQNQVVTQALKMFDEQRQK